MGGWTPNLPPATPLMTSVRHIGQPRACCLSWATQESQKRWCPHGTKESRASRCCTRHTSRMSCDCGSLTADWGWSLVAIAVVVDFVVVICVWICHTINWLYWLTRCGPQPLQRISIRPVTAATIAANSTRCRLLLWAAYAWLLLIAAIMVNCPRSDKHLVQLQSLLNVLNGRILQDWADIMNTRCSIQCRFPHVPVLHFPPLQSGATFSSPTFSGLAFSASPFVRQLSFLYCSYIAVVRSALLCYNRVSVPMHVQEMCNRFYRASTHNNGLDNKFFIICCDP